MDDKAKHIGALIMVAAAMVMSWYITTVLATLIADRVFAPRPWDALTHWRQFSLQHGVFRGTLLAVSAVATVATAIGLFWLYDDRRSTHGNARFATARDLDKGGLFSKAGIILAKFGRRYLVFGGQEFVLVAAPTRSGKGVSIVIPNLLNWQDSVICKDVKKENFLMTSRWRQTVLKQEVFLFDPFDPQGMSNRWNPLDAVSRDPNLAVADVLQIAQVFYPSSPGDKNRFFQDTAQSLFMGLALYLIETNHPRTTIGEVFRQGSGYGKPLVEHVQEIMTKHPNLSNACAGALSRLLSAPGETFGNIKATFDAALIAFSIPTVDWATSGSDFNLGDVRRKKMSIYFGVPVDKLGLAQRIINLFFTQLINLNTRKLPEDDPSLKYQCLIANDEFTAAGRLDVVLKGVAFIAGYNLRLLTIIQSTSQLKDPANYGREGAETLLANHAIRVIFPPSTNDEAKDYSEMLGTYTKDVMSVSRSSNAKGMLGIGEAVSVGSNTSEQRRALLLPQELKRLPPDVCIVEKQGINPAKCRKAFYYEDPIFLRRLAQASPAFNALLASGPRPSQAAMTEMRSRGEFAARIHTTAFEPFTHPHQQPPGSAQGPVGLTTPVYRAPVDPAAPASGPAQAAAQTAPTFSLAEGRHILLSRIPDFDAVATAEDWIDIVLRETRALFPHLEGDTP